MSEHTQACNGILTNLTTIMRQMCVLADATHAAIETMRVLNRALMIAEMPVVGGEWPDRFVLLNRYLRTGRSQSG